MQLPRPTPQASTQRPLRDLLGALVVFTIVLPLTPLRRRLGSGERNAVGRTPAPRVERFTRLHDVQQHRHELPRYGAHRTRLLAAIPSTQRQVLLAVESSLLTPAASEQE